MSTVSIPAPVNRGVRRTSSHATSARLRLRPVRRLRSTDDGHPAGAARAQRAPLAASAKTGGPATGTGPGTGSDRARDGGDDDPRRLRRAGAS